MIWIILYIGAVALFACFTTPPSTLRDGPWKGGNG